MLTASLLRGHGSGLRAMIRLSSSLRTKPMPFNGLLIDLTQPEGLQSAKFDATLAESISQWKQQDKSAVWIKYSSEAAHLQTIAFKHGFTYHHAEGNYVMMLKWMREGPSRVPDYGTHTVGAGGFILNENKEVLVVQERTGTVIEWKLPGGMVNVGEDLMAGCLREVREETGVQASFHSLLGFRHSHHAPFGRSDLYYILRLTATADQHISMDHSELGACKWMPLDQYIAGIRSPVNGFVARIVKEQVQAERVAPARSSQSTASIPLSSSGFHVTPLQSIIPPFRISNFYHVPTQVIPPTGPYTPS